MIEVSHQKGRTKGGTVISHKALSRVPTPPLIRPHESSSRNVTHGVKTLIHTERSFLRFS
jgi:hypothetical protein